MLPPFSEWPNLPPLPRYADQLHPLVVHFPVALLMVAPLFVFLSMILFRKGRWFGFSALLLLALGTGGAYVAVYSGEAARDLQEDLSDEAQDALDKHEELAESIPTVFTILTGVYAAILIVPMIIRPLSHAAVLFVLNAGFLVALGGADLLLAHAAYQGGLLVHDFDVRASLAAPAEEGPPAATPDKQAEQKPAAEPQGDKN